VPTQMVRNNFPPLLAPGLRHIFVQWFDLKMREAQYDKIFNMGDSEDAYEIDYELSGTGPMPVMPEGNRPAYDGIVQGGTKKYLHLQYGLASQVTRQLVEDDKYGIIKQIPKAHARSALYGREAVCAAVFNLGNATVLTNDGVSLFNTEHPLLGGTQATVTAPGVQNIINAAGTYPNRPTPDADLSFTAIQQAIQTFYRMVDGRGIPVTVRPKNLVIAPENTFIAREILGSAGKPYTANNELNSLQAENLSYTVMNYLTGPQNWFLLADKEGHQLKFYERVPVQAQTDDDFITQVLIFLSTQRFSAGATTWYGTYGSFGT
jgi:Mu-like prophage major head subunit gpT